MDIRNFCLAFQHNGKTVIVEKCSEYLIIKYSDARYLGETYGYKDENFNSRNIEQIVQMAISKLPILNKEIEDFKKRNVA